MQIIPEFSVFPNESYHGLILTLQDALLVLEASRLNILPKVKRRLNDAERKNITAGSVFAWNETECGMKRWTDGKTWLASKVKGPFLTYHEIDLTRNMKPNGLIKQSFSITTKQNEKFHLIAYYSLLDTGKPPAGSKVPCQDSLFAKLLFDPNIYLNEVLHFNNPDMRTGAVIQPQVQQLPVPQVQLQQPMDMHAAAAQPGIPVYHPMPTTYYCHPLMVSYQYVSSVPVPQAYQLPQQSMYFQPVGVHGHHYHEGQPPNASVHYAHPLTQNRLLSTVSVPGGALPSLLPSAPPAYFGHDAHSPAFTYGVKRVNLLLLVHSASLPNPGPPRSSPLPGQLPDLRPPLSVTSSTSSTMLLRLPSAHELFLPAGLADTTVPPLITKLREPKLFSV